MHQRGNIAPDNRLWYNVKHKVIYLRLIGLISTVWTCLARAWIKEVHLYAKVLRPTLRDEFILVSLHDVHTFKWNSSVAVMAIIMSYVASFWMCSVLNLIHPGRLRELLKAPSIPSSQWALQSNSKWFKNSYSLIQNTSFIFQFIGNLQEFLKASEKFLVSIFFFFILSSELYENDYMTTWLLHGLLSECMVEDEMGLWFVDIDWKKDKRRCQCQTGIWCKVFTSI